MNFILFGPPGIGKSTIIGILKTAGHSALDLEDLYPNKIRFSIPSLVDNCFIGAADLNPARTYRNCKKIFLSMDQKQYEERRAKRDAQIPGKGQQKEHLISDWLKGVTYDAVIDVTDQSKTIAALLSMKGEK